MYIKIVDTDLVSVIPKCLSQRLKKNIGETAPPNSQSLVEETRRCHCREAGWHSAVGQREEWDRCRRCKCDGLTGDERGGGGGEGSGVCSCWVGRLLLVIF